VSRARAPVAVRNMSVPIFLLRSDATHMDCRVRRNVIRSLSLPRVLLPTVITPLVGTCLSRCSILLSVAFPACHCGARDCTQKVIRGGTDADNPGKIAAKYSFKTRSAESGESPHAQSLALAMAAAAASGTSMRDSDGNELVLESPFLDVTVPVCQVSITHSPARSYRREWSRAFVVQVELCKVNDCTLALLSFPFSQEQVQKAIDLHERALQLQPHHVPAICNYAGVQGSGFRV